jgi:1-deoxy-D-xylulose-5-phosphate synthase
LEKLVFRIKRALKGLLLTNTLFSDLGFEYAGFFNGHNIEELEKVFKKVKKINLPVVVHVLTKKGKGYPPAEADPAEFHGVSAHELGAEESVVSRTETFTSVFAREVVRLASGESKIVAITPAMTKGSGLSEFASMFPGRFFDVGIAEEHAITFAAGLATAGVTPVVAFYSTFMQRAIDQIITDVALPALPVVIALDRAGAVPNDGETHQGAFDIALLLPVPSLTLIAPASAHELEESLRWAVRQTSPVGIRYPRNRCPPEEPSFFAPFEKGRGVLLTSDELALEADAHSPAPDARKILFVCTGGIFPETLLAAKLLAQDKIASDIYNLRFLKPLDETYFLELAAKYPYIFFIEDGVRTGGIGRFLERLVQKYVPATATLSLGFPDRFLPQGTREEILEDAELSPRKIAEAVRRTR